MTYSIDATYSPDDNKIRLYSTTRLDTETYNRLKDAGYKYAPKQELFFAPMWTPNRADIALELAGSIGDEDSTLADRAEDRADRFDGYQANRTRDAESATSHVKQLTDNIPLGQPILVGHHSEKHARKHAKQIERGMERAVKMWDTAAYWEQRAKGAIRHAKYLERPDVRARRIKKIGAALRKAKKTTDASRMMLKSWSNPDSIKRKDGEPITKRDQCLFIAGREPGGSISQKFTLEKYPRDLPASQYEGMQSVWGALRENIITPEQAQQISIDSHEAIIKYQARWIEHYENRLIYEKAMLDDQGGSDLLKPAPRKKLPPLLNYDGERTVKNLYGSEPTTYTNPEHMTKAEYAAIHTDYKGARLVQDGSHRVRTAMIHSKPNAPLNAVFLTDSKVHEIPDPNDLAIIDIEHDYPSRLSSRPIYCKPVAKIDPAEEMRKALKTGVKTVSAPQLFVTPPALCIRMAKLAEFEPYQKVLEPSAGTGNILKAILGFTGFIDKSEPTYLWNTPLTAIELNGELCNQLRRTFGNTAISCADFLECEPSNLVSLGDDDPKEMGLYDRILMNPPFKNASDIKHIKHALKFLAPGGRLIAICANGSRQQDQLKPLAEDGGFYEPLPAGTFSSAGTQVNTALLVINAPEETKTPTGQMGLF